MKKMGMHETILIIRPVHPAELKNRDLINETANKIMYPEGAPKRNVDKKIGKSDMSTFSIGTIGMDK